MLKSSFQRIVSAAALFLIITFAMPTIGQSEGISLPRPDSYHFTKNTTSVQLAARMLGYVVAQNASLDFIAETYPDLAPRAFSLKRGFKATFSFPSQRAIWFLEDAYNGVETTDLIENTRKTAIKQIKTSSRQDAILMLDEMELRIDGEVSSTELKTMLWLKFAPHPEDEMHNWAITYSSAGHPKSNGMEIQLKIPLSWRREEGNRPHIISKWVSQDGSGDMIITLVLKKSPGSITHEEIEAFAKNNQWEELTPNGFTSTNGAAVTLDRQPAVSLDMTGIGKALDVEILNHARSYIIFPVDNVVNLSCMLGSAPDGDLSIIESRFEKLKRLCRRVALSVSFPDTYR